MWIFEKFYRVIDHEESVYDNGDRCHRYHCFTKSPFLHQAGKKSQAKECRDGTEAKDKHDYGTPQRAQCACRSDCEEVDESTWKKAVYHAQKIEAEYGTVAHECFETLLVP